MRTSEWIALGYLAYLLACGIRRPPGRARFLVLALACAGLVATILLLAACPASPLVTLLRDWLPGIYLIAGYWLSGLFFGRPDLGWEKRLARVDRRLFRRLGLERFVHRAPRALLECLELAYLFVYPMVPAGLAVLVFGGPSGTAVLHASTGTAGTDLLQGLSRSGGLAGLAADPAGPANLYWTTVLIAGYLAYGTLPWIATRPPRTLEGRSAMDGRGLWVRRLNLRILDRASIQINTFPSGHAATGVAAAAAVAWHEPWAGLAFGTLAAGILAGSVLGRYHYALDALLGTLAALVAVAAGMALAG